MPLPASREGLYSTSMDVFAPSAARTTNGSSSVLWTGGCITGIVIEVRVTAASGTTPQLNLFLEDTFDGTNWNQVATVNAAAITTTGATVKRINLRDFPCTDNLRVSWTITGTTPSFTFVVNAFLDRD
jgi:hypothetical protein